jgi:hypothetical protein
MGRRQKTTSVDGSRNRTIALVLPCYLIATLLWRALVPAHEMPLRDVQVLEIVLDIMAVVGLIGMKARIARPLFWTALAAGVLLFVIRLSSDTSWWTGHLVYAIPPR